MVSAKKFPGLGQWKNKDREIAPISTHLLYQWRVRGRTGHTPRIQLKGTLHQEPSVKNEEIFWRNTPFLENAYLFRKYQNIIVQKNFIF